MRKRERNSQLGKPVCRWEDNTGVDVKEMSGRDWKRVNFLLDRYKWRAAVNTIRKLPFPWNSWKFLTSWGTVGLSRRAPGGVS
jgi:hypothetical protein